MFYSYGAHFSQSAAQAQSDANAAQADAREAKSETDLLRHDVNRLLLITEALWTLLKKERGYADEVLADLVKEIDLRDGCLDGKTAKANPLPCPTCGKINLSTRTRCIYCGNPLPVTLFAS